MTRDLRKYTQQTNIRLVIGALLILFIIGDGLIYLIYGQYSAVLGLVCILGGLAPVALIWLVLWGMDQIVKRADRD